MVEAMTEAEWREIVEDLMFQFAYRGHDKGGRYLWTGGLSTLEGAFAALGWVNPHRIEEYGCQWPGCTDWATCGTPTPDGYRNYCGKHFRESQAKS